MRRRISKEDRDILQHDSLLNAPQVKVLNIVANNDNDGDSVILNNSNSNSNRSPTPLRALTSRRFMLLVSVLLVLSLIMFGLLAVVGGGGDGDGNARDRAERLRGAGGGIGGIGGIGGEATRSTSILFSNEFEGAPQCTPIDASDVTYTLVTQCSKDRLWMIGHQCKRWGTDHPISLVVYTEQTHEEVTRVLVEGGCTLHQISHEGGGNGNVQIVDPSDYDEASDYPVNLMRNMAIAAVQTSHIMYVDVDFWLSTGLYDRLMESTVRQEFASDDRLAIVVPAFQTNSVCGEGQLCDYENIQVMPSTMNELNKLLHQKKGSVFDPTNWQGHRTTNYHAWFHLGESELHDIPCFQSNRYEPYIAFRYCAGAGSGADPAAPAASADDWRLPPFQTAFSGYGKNKLTWIMHLRHNGYIFKTLGKAYIIHYPHLESKARVEWNKRPEQLKPHMKPSQLVAAASSGTGNRSGSGSGSGSTINWLEFKRGSIDALYIKFTTWLETLQDKSRVPICEHVGGDGVELWVDAAANKSFNNS